MGALGYDMAAPQHATCPAFAAATAPSPYAVVVKQPTAVANTLESLSRHLDPIIVFAMAWGSFSPPQLDTSAAMGARW